MGFLRGRMNRATYWACIGCIAAMVGAFYFFGGVQPRVTEVVLILLVVPRLHDIDRSGWIAIGVFALEITIALVLSVWLDDEELVLEGLVFVALAIAVLLIWLGTIPGDQYGNRYGEAPRPGVGFGRR